jgi:hypothetical protein
MSDVVDLDVGGNLLRYGHPHESGVYTIDRHMTCRQVLRLPLANATAASSAWRSPSSCRCSLRRSACRWVRSCGSACHVAIRGRIRSPESAPSKRSILAGTAVSRRSIQRSWVSVLTASAQFRLQQGRIAQEGRDPIPHRRLKGIRVAAGVVQLNLGGFTVNSPGGLSWSETDGIVLHPAHRRRKVHPQGRSDHASRAREHEQQLSRHRADDRVCVGMGRIVSPDDTRGHIHLRIESSRPGH